MKVININWDFLNSYSLNTKRTYKKIVEDYLYFSKGVVNQELVQKFINKSNNSSTARTKYYALKTFFKYNGIEFNEPIRLPRVERRYKDALSEKDIERLLAEVENIKSWQVRTIIKLLLHTGLRLQEILDLSLSDIDKELNHIIVYGKGSKERIVPLNKQARESLNEYITKKRLKRFLKQGSNKRLFTVTQQAVRHHLGKIAKKLNIKVSPHILRHTFATLLIKKGVDVKTVSELLGHSNVKITLEFYIHPDKEQLKQAVTKLEEI